MLVSLVDPKLTTSLALEEKKAASEYRSTIAEAGSIHPSTRWSAALASVTSTGPAIA